MLFSSAASWDWHSGLKKRKNREDDSKRSFGGLESSFIEYKMDPRSVFIAVFCHKRIWKNSYVDNCMCLEKR